MLSTRLHHSLCAENEEPPPCLQQPFLSQNGPSSLSWLFCCLSITRMAAAVSNKALQQFPTLPDCCTFMPPREAQCFVEIRTTPISWSADLTFHCYFSPSVQKKEVHHSF